MSRYPGSLYEAGGDIMFILYYDGTFDLYREFDEHCIFWMGPNMPTHYDLVLQ